MRIVSMAAIAGMLCVSQSALAAVKLVNRDSTSHDVLIKCSSTTDGSVGASSTRDLGNGPCTVTVKKTGSTATASGNDSLIIKDGKISK
ncbi:MAG: hypothetical protein NOF05_12225 [Candidatus Accumulibacter phosphatis]|nr:hypothetical protein [Candidatus Accumulibacter phosphatis]